MYWNLYTNNETVFFLVYNYLSSQQSLDTLLTFRMHYLRITRKRMSERNSSDPLLWRGSSPQVLSFKDHGDISFIFLFLEYGQSQKQPSWKALKKNISSVLFWLKAESLWAFRRFLSKWNSCSFYEPQRLNCPDNNNLSFSIKSYEMTNCLHAMLSFTPQNALDYCFMFPWGAKPSQNSSFSFLLMIISFRKLNGRWVWNTHTPFPDLDIAFHLLNIQ